jgi:hypothetical protein
MSKGTRHDQLHEVTAKDLVGAFESVEAYDPVTNSWMTLPSMPMPRHGIAGAVSTIAFTW